MPAPRRTICLSGGQALFGGVEEDGLLETMAKRAVMGEISYVIALPSLLTPFLRGTKMTDDALAKILTLGLCKAQETNDISSLSKVLTLTNLQALDPYQTQMTGDFVGMRALKTLQGLDQPASLLMKSAAGQDEPLSPAWAPLPGPSRASWLVL